MNLMNKKEKIFLALAYAVTAILTLLPFFEVGFTNSDDFQYYNTAHNSLDYWFEDASIYAKIAGRFYFLITKYFYYVPYLIDNMFWTKFMQYAPLFACYLLSAQIVYLIFDSKRLGALTLLVLVFNMSIGLCWFYVPTAYPFFFTFSFMIFLLGVLLYVNYTKKDGYWRIILSSVLFFISYLFYENYLVFAVIFCCCVFARNWKKTGFVTMLKSKSFYKETVPYAVSLVVYMICYIGYRQYVVRTGENADFYGGTVLSPEFSWANFFTIVYRCTIYTLPGMPYSRHYADVAANSLFVSGHYDNIWFIVTHASAVAYVNALLQCGILWTLVRKTRFAELSGKGIALGFVTSLLFAFSSHILIAISYKYNYGLANVIWCYVPTFYSYFGVMLAIAFLIVASLKYISNNKVASAVGVVWCVLLAVFSLINSYTNDSLKREWVKSQNRVTVVELMAKDGLFDNVPDESIIYTEQLHNTSRIGLSLCYETNDFENLISRVSGKHYYMEDNWNDLLAEVDKRPESPVYLMQVTESKKYGELLLAISHVSSMDGDASNVVADKADIVYYSPTKDYVLYYNLGADHRLSKSVNVVSNDKNREITHVSLEEEGMNPFGFSVSNIVVPTADTIYLP